MREAVIVSAVRTAIARANRGGFKDTRPDTLAAVAIAEALRRAPGVLAKDVEDVVLGCAQPEAEQGLNVARLAALLAGLPPEVPAMTINRFCASGLQALAIAADRIASGAIDIAVAGGLESMSAIPMGGWKVSANPELLARVPAAYTPMGNTAENVARRFGIGRDEQDRFALASHQKAVAAQAAGKFADEIVPVKTIVFEGPGASREVTVDRDEGPRADTTIERLAALKLAFDPTGTVTAGNSSQVSDGAAAMVVVERERAKALGLAPLAVLRGFAVAGVEPDVMGVGPVPAVRRLLARTPGAPRVADVDFWELNEAFASQAIYCAREIGIPADRLNVNGGAIALGHPLGCTGARMVASAIAELRRRDARTAVLTMCIGGGMGAAGLLERAS